MKFTKYIYDKKFNETEKKIIEYLDNNIDRLEDGLSIQEVAQENFTSTSSVFRLAKKMGFKGYSDLVYTLTADEPDKTLHNISEDKVIQLASSIWEVFDSNKVTFEKYKDQFNDSASSIIILANGYSKVMADYLAMKFHSKGIHAFVVSSSDSLQLINSNIHKLQQVICISKSGETSSLLPFLNIALVNKIPVISFTQRASSKIAQLSKFSFVVNPSNAGDWDNINANSFYPLLLMYFESMLDELIVQ